MTGHAEVADRLDQLLAGATVRQPFKVADSKSAASFERALIGGEWYVLKVMDGRRDWLAIASGDQEGRAVCLFEDGVYADLPPEIDPAVVGAARLDAEGGPFPCVLLMHDVTDVLVAEDAPVDTDTHAAFLDAMAALHARFWEAAPRTTYMPLARAYLMLSPGEARRQHAAGTAGDVQTLIAPGWESVGAQVPELFAAVRPLLDDPRPLVDALMSTPRTFLQGDWKMGNLGRHVDGRVVLLDWDRPTFGPCTTELAWYLAINCDRLPESKDDAVQRYRHALEAKGVRTGDWWDAQLALALLGGFLQLGWSKAGQDEELHWWDPAVRPALAILGGT